MYVLVGIAFFLIYYVVFRFLIGKFNFKTIGREDAGQETKLYSKQEYKESRSKKEESQVNPSEGEPIMAGVIVEALGGAENINTVTNCYTRLRLTVQDSSKVDEETLKNQTGASGVIIKDQNVQVVYGLQVGSVRKAVDKFLVD